ncbi:hypothetical protein GCM10027037_19650 [Mucilaginibacter koreensis]
MNSIGNDVVALAGINPERTRQYRFYSKILSVNEQDAYPALQHSLPFEHYVWLLWSVKESAYKFFKRLQPDLVFSPTKLIVEDVSCPTTGKYQGRVTCNGLFIYFNADYTNDYIHSIVGIDATFKYIHAYVNQIAQSDYSSQSAAVRQFALQKLATLWPDAEISFRQHDIGYPEVLIDQKTIMLPLSFSHDGRYTAYAFNYMNFEAVST